MTTGHDFPAATTLSETGALPGGVSFGDNGNGTATLSGTPNAGTAGTYSLTITAHNGIAPDATQSFTLTVAVALVVNPPTLPVATVGNAFSQQLTASAGSGTVDTFTATGSLDGLTLSTSGLVSGNPATATGSPFTFTVNVVDNAHGAGSRKYTLTVDPAIAVSPTTLPVATLAKPYSQQLTASGGSGTGYAFQAAGALDGLTLSSSGLLSGTPTTATGSPFSFTVTVTDSNGATGSQTYELTVSAGGIGISPTTLLVATVGNAFSQQFTASGGSGTGYVFSSTGSLDGLTLSSSGLLSGNPSTATGSPFGFTVTVTDSNRAAGSQNYSLTVDPAITVAATTLPTAAVGTPYSQQLTASGGSGTGYAFSATGSLDGLSLSSSGLLSGTPTTATGSPFGFSVTVTDSDHATGVQSYSLVVGTNAAHTIQTIAGNGIAGYTGDGGAATAAQLEYPGGLALDSQGNLYIADSGNNAVREIKADGTIVTIVGNGNAAYTGDGGPAADADLSFPTAVAVDSSGNLYIADGDNSVVREVHAATGIITTIAGNGAAGLSGDGGPATAAELNYPTAVAVDQNGDVFIADFENNDVREVNATTGIITTIAGDGTAGYSGDGGPATAAELSAPTGLALDGHGNLYIADYGSSVVRKVNATGTITTVAGNGYQGYSGDGGPAAAAELNAPYGLAVDAHGNLYIADAGNNVIRVVAAANGTISTIAGNATQGYSGDGGPAVDAEMHFPSGVAVDPSGNIYIGDTGNSAVREVFSGTVALTIRPVSLPAATVGTSYSEQLTAAGGTGTGYVFSTTSALDGLTLSSTGLLSGNPTTAAGALLTFTVTVTDSSGATGSQVLTLAVNQPGFSYDPATMTLTIAGTQSQNTFTFSQASSVDASNTLHTVYTFTLNGTVASYPGTALANVVVTATGSDNTAILITTGNLQQTRETISLGSLTDPGAGTLQKYDAAGNPYTFLTLSNFPYSYAYVGRNDGTVSLYGSEGEQYNGFVSAGNYAYIAGPGMYHEAQGASSVYGYSAGLPTDFAYHYSGNAGSAYVVSGTAYSYMSGTDQNPNAGNATQSFFNVAAGFVQNTGVSNHPGQDYAYIIDSPGNDTFVGGTAYSYMYSIDANGNFTEFDAAFAFALVYAQSFVGGFDTAINNDSGKNILGGNWNLE